MSFASQHSNNAVTWKWGIATLNHLGQQPDALALTHVGDDDIPYPSDFGWKLGGIKTSVVADRRLSDFAKVRADYRKDVLEDWLFDFGTASIETPIYEATFSLDRYETQSPLVSSLTRQDQLPYLVFQRSQLEYDFNTLMEQWIEDTKYLSSIQDIVIDLSYQKIIGMGRQALPYIFRNIQRQQSLWFWALHAITREDPVPKNVNGSAAVDTWLRWGREHGYIV